MHRKCWKQTFNRILLVKLNPPKTRNELNQTTMCQSFYKITAFSLILLCCASGCSGKLFTVYKIDVQQGNAVEPEKVELLEVGMTKEQVKFLLGTPMVADVFHPDRWDYVYYFIPGYGERERRHLTLHFNGNNISEIVKNQISAPAQSDTEPETEES